MDNKYLQDVDGKCVSPHRTIDVIIIYPAHGLTINIADIEDEDSETIITPLMVITAHDVH